jgi:RNA polymerase sigma-70 factor (ECF subfamily)
LRRSQLLRTLALAGEAIHISTRISDFNAPTNGRGNGPGMVESAYRQHWSDVCRYVRHRFGAGPPDPEEVAQGAFARLASVQHEVSIENPRAFLYRCAQNIVADHHRRARVRGQVHEDMRRSAQEEGLSDFSPERVLLGKERLALLEETLARMPAMRRRIFLLVRAEGMRPKDVAHQFGMAERSVYQHVSRAMRECEAAFAAAEREAGDC